MAPEAGAFFGHLLSKRFAVSFPMPVTTKYLGMRKRPKKGDGKQSESRVPLRAQGHFLTWKPSVPRAGSVGTSKRPSDPLEF